MKYTVHYFRLMPRHIRNLAWETKANRTKMEAIKADIDANGLRNPILVLNGWNVVQKKLDPSWCVCDRMGGNRLQACLELDIPVWVLMSDWIGTWRHYPALTTKEEVQACFMDPPSWVKFGVNGLQCNPPGV